MEHSDFEQESDYEDILSSIRDMLESDDDPSSMQDFSEEPEVTAQSINKPVNSASANPGIKTAKATNTSSAKIFELTPDMLVLLGSKVKMKDKAALQAGQDGSLDTIFKKWLVSHKQEIIGLMKNDKPTR